MDNSNEREHRPREADEVVGQAAEAKQQTADAEEMQRIRRWFDEAWLGGDVSIAPEIFASDVFVSTGAGTVRGIESVQAGALHLRETTEGLSGHIQLVGGRGRYVASYWLFGRNVGPLGGIPPTNERVVIAGVVTLQLERGLVARVWQTCSIRPAVSDASPPERVRRDDWVQSWQLTSREASVASLVMEGLSDKEIAANLGLATSSIHKYLQRVLRKSKARSRNELAELAGMVAIG